VNQAVHIATRQGGGPHGEYKMCIRGTSTKVERIRPEIDPASQRVVDQYEMETLLHITKERHAR
jgi:hypothetical protein